MMSQFKSNRPTHLAAIAVGLLVMPTLRAQTQTLYDTNRVLEEKYNACRQSSPCKTFEREPLSVDAGGNTTVTVQCPARHPYLIGWDAEHHEHIAVAVLPGTQTPNGLKLIVANHADAPGSATVFLGCSERAIRETSVMQLVDAVPTGPLTKR